MDKNELIPHLFRTEYSRICAVLCKAFGIEYLETAEDIASDTFLAAMESWTYNGIPVNPVAWLYTVAKNKARNQLKRNLLFNNKIRPLLTPGENEEQRFEIDLSESNITDSQLKMLFALCHPSLTAEAQIGLSLRILCGFGITEIAGAFLTNKETINKRLTRAREKLRQQSVSIELPSQPEISSRLENVLRTLYLLFSEGYYSESNDMLLREELCNEAMRLTALLLQNKSTNLSPVNALMALMCFHASRFKARKNENGAPVLYQEQDETLWDAGLITKGMHFLREASQGVGLSKYHLEAGIAYWHTVKNNEGEKWPSILRLYDLLLQIEQSPMAALNRVYALSRVRGKEAAIEESKTLAWMNSQYYFTLMAELHSETEIEKAVHYLRQALSVAKTKTERTVIESRMNKLAQISNHDNDPWNSGSIVF